MATQYKNPYLDYYLPKVSYASGVLHEQESKESQQKYNQALAAAEYDAAIQLMLDERNYTSFASQVQRMRAAGLNPDILGTQQESSGDNPQVQRPELVPHDPLAKGQHIANISQQFLQLIPQALDLFTSFKGSIQSLEMNQLQIDSQMQQLGSFDAIDALSPDDFDSDGNLKHSSLSKYQQYIDRRLLALGYDMNKKRNSRSASRRARQYLLGIDNLVRNNNERLRSGVYAKYANGADYRNQYLSTIGQYGYNLNDDDFVDILQDFNEIVFKDEKQSASNRYKSNLNKVGLNLMEKGQKNINAGNKISGSIEYILGLLINNNMMPSFSTTKGPKGRSSTLGF